MGLPFKFLLTCPFFKKKMVFFFFYVFGARERKREHTSGRGGNEAEGESES